MVIETLFLSPGFQWQVDQCVQDLNCVPNPCYPGVQCELQDDVPVCGACPPGLIGDGLTCTRQVDHCSNNPCFPGVECFNHDSNFRCGLCPEGFDGNGIDCQPAADPCNPNPCYPGVACLTVWKGRQTLFECGLCPDGMIGDGLNCTLTDPCTDNLCPPGTLCMSTIRDTVRSYECRSELSSTVPCPDAHHCFAGVECIKVNNYITCGKCPKGYDGDGISCQKLQNCENCDFEDCPETCNRKYSRISIYGSLSFSFTIEI